MHKGLLVFIVVTLLGFGFGLSSPGSSPVLAASAPQFVWPWPQGEGWGYNTGPHDTPTALDFQPIGISGCSPAVDTSHVVKPMAPGTVVAVKYPAPAYGANTQVPVSVIIDHGGGWVSYTTHLANTTVGVGSKVDYNTALGNPSCYYEPGFSATGRHVHVGLFYNSSPLGLFDTKVCGWSLAGQSPFALSKPGHATAYPLYLVDSQNNYSLSGYPRGTVTNDACPLSSSSNSATATDVPNPDAYTCSQPGFVNFESFTDGTNLSSGTISGVHFTTTNGYTWRVGDFTTGYYNGKYPYSYGFYSGTGYTSGGTHWAWLGESQGAGRIDFPAGLASSFSLLVSAYTPVYLDAYGSGGNLLATAGPSPSNYGTGHMTELKVTRAVSDMAYVIVHDSGNYFLIDDVCTNAPSTPNTIKNVVNQTYFMQTGQQVQGSFFVDFVAGAKQILHFFLGPFFSDVDLNLTRPDGSPVLGTDPGVTINKTANSADVTIDNAPPGTWQYQIVANQLDVGGEAIAISGDEETILLPNTPPVLTLPSDQSVQFSDALSFGVSCSDTDGDSLALSASGLPSGLAFTDNGDGTGSVSGAPMVATGIYPVTFVCDDGFNSPVTGYVNVVVTPEDAVVTPASTNPAAVEVNSPGGTAGPVTLSASIAESADDSTNGDIGNAVPVTYQLIPVGPGTTYTCTAATSGGGVGGTLTADCTFSDVAVNLYDVHISVGGNYYQGSADGILTVYDPSLGFVTGGGYVTHNGVVANFGFNAKYLKHGQIQGSLLYIEHRATGDVVVKSNAMGSMAIVGNMAYILGKATLTGVGNYSFTATAVDNGEPGTSDQFGLEVDDPGGAVVPDLAFSPITLGGGNIVVPHS